MFHVRGVFRMFFREGVPIFVTFLSAVFSAELISSKLSNKNDSRGSGGMLPREIFENLHTLMAILVSFKQVFENACHIFGPNFECFINGAFFSK